MNKIKTLFSFTTVLVFIFFGTSFLFAKQEAPGIGIGSDAAYPYVEKILKKLPLKSGIMYTATDAEVEELINLAADIQINIFELLDCTYRYLTKHNMRIKINGESLQRLLPTFDFGKERVMALLPIDKIMTIKTGTNLNENDHALDVYMNEEYEEYIEIGTALYDKHFGFSKIEPNLFSEAFGMRVKKWASKKSITQIHLYDRGKAAIFVKGFFRSKHWYIWLITRK